MLVRDVEGRLIIISRADCKNEHTYNEKLYNIRLGYIAKYKGVNINPPKEPLKSTTTKSKYLSDD
jgi:hypothetical protein